MYLSGSGPVSQAATCSVRSEGNEPSRGRLGLSARQFYLVAFIPLPSPSCSLHSPSVSQPWPQVANIVGGIGKTFVQPFSIILRVKNNRKIPIFSSSLLHKIIISEKRISKYGCILNIFSKNESSSPTPPKYNIFNISYI